MQIEELLNDLLKKMDNKNLKKSDLKEDVEKISQQAEALMCKEDVSSGINELFKKQCEMLAYTDTDAFSTVKYAQKKMRKILTRYNIGFIRNFYYDGNKIIAEIVPLVVGFQKSGQKASGKLLLEKQKEILQQREIRTVSPIRNSCYVACDDSTLLHLKLLINEWGGTIASYKTKSHKNIFFLDRLIAVFDLSRLYQADIEKLDFSMKITDTLNDDERCDLIDHLKNIKESLWILEWSSKMNQSAYSLIGSCVYWMCQIVNTKTPLSVSYEKSIISPSLKQRKASDKKYEKISEDDWLKIQDTYQEIKDVFDENFKDVFTEVQIYSNYAKCIFIPDAVTISEKPEWLEPSFYKFRMDEASIQKFLEKAKKWFPDICFQDAENILYDKGQLYAGKWIFHFSAKLSENTNPWP